MRAKPSRYNCDGISKPGMKRLNGMEWQEKKVNEDSISLWFLGRSGKSQE